MANERRPSIYADRGTIGSYDELDEYGVWVKSEPQELSAGADFLADLSADEPEEALGLEIPDISDLPNDDLDNFQLDNLPDLDNFQVESSSEDSAADLSDYSNNIDLEDEFTLPEIGEIEEIAEEFASDSSDNEQPRAGQLEIDESDFDEISMDDLIMPLETEMEAPPEEDGFLASDDDLIELSEEEFPADKLFEDEFLGQDDGEYAAGDFTADTFDAAADTMPPLSDSLPPSSASALESSGSAGTNLSTQLLMKIADELSSIRSELSSLKREFSSISPAPRPSQEDEKIALTGDELSDILGSPPAPPPPAELAEDDFLSKEEDEKIALTGDELSNILNTADFTEETGADTSDTEIEDELLAAPFAEDTFEDAFPEIEMDAGVDSLVEADLPDFAPVDLDLDIDTSEDFGSEISLDDTPLEELEATTIDPLELEEIPGEEPLAEDALPDFAFEEAEELQEILENGVEPITSAPDVDDSLYLSEEILSEDILSADPLSEDSLSEEPLDLSEAVIDDPDFSADIQDISVEEPALQDISIDLDMEEELSLSDNLLDEQPLAIEDMEDISGEEMQFPEDFSGSQPSDFEPFETFDPKPSSNGGDLSLIPEGLVVGSETDSLLESDSADFNPAEFDPAEFGDFANEPEPSPQEAQADFSQASSLDNMDNFLTDDPSDLMSEDLSADIIDDMDIPGEVLEIQDGIPSISGQSPGQSLSQSPQGSLPGEIPSHLKQELRTVLSYMDQLLEALPDEKIEEFAKSEHYDTYKKLFKELGLV